MELIASIGLGLGLAAAAGFRVFVPLLALSLAARFDFIALKPELDWVGSTPALIALVVAAVVEILSYLIPIVDNLLDTIATPAAVVAGTVVMGSVLVDMAPLWTWSLAIIAGGGTAAVVQGGTVAARAASTVSTAGVANPVVGAGETVGSVGFSVLALALPVLTAIAVILLVIVVIGRAPRLIAKLRRPPRTTLPPDS